MAESSTSWAQNPMHKKQEYAQASLPQLLFRKCHLNCVDSDNFSAETPAEQECIKNCQDKTYAAFDLYMAVRMLKESNARAPIDVAAYVGFETEHSNDTAGVIKDDNHKTMPIGNIESFSKRQRSDFKGLRTSAHSRH